MWDSFQQEMLAALGHVLYRPAGDDHALAETLPTDARASAVAELEPPSESAAAIPLSLLRALARAAAVAPDQLPPLPPAPRLRSAAGKRTLWPALRALRRSQER